MFILKKVFNARYTIMTLMILISSRIALLSANKVLNASTDMLLLLSMCFLGFAVRHKKLIEKPKKKKHKTKWIEVF
ncbi:MAG: hypothetical protein ACRCTZ_19740 [Sarcina sp.]